MNKNLAIIKKACNHGSCVDAVDLIEIEGAADRMAAEVEDKNKTIEELQNLLHMAHETLKMILPKEEIEKRETGISRLKAELAKRPKIVRCGECAKSTAKLGKTTFGGGKFFCKYFLKYCEESDFCSNGKRIGGQSE